MEPSPVLQRTRPPNSATLPKQQIFPQQQLPQHQRREPPQAGPSQEPQQQPRHQQAMYQEPRPQHSHLQLPLHQPKPTASRMADLEAAARWFDDPADYQHMLDEIAAISLDKTFRDELNAIEHWFKVLSEPEQTTAVYSLLFRATQMQLRFFSTVLQQRVRGDPVLAAELAEKEQQWLQQQQTHRFLSTLTTVGGKSDDVSRTRFYPSPRGPVSVSSGLATGSAVGERPAGGRPRAAFDSGLAPAGHSTGDHIQRPRSAMGLRITPGVASAWSGAPMSAVAASFADKIGSSIERPKSAGPMAAAMHKGTADAASSTTGSKPLPFKVPADVARLLNPPATAIGAPGSLSLPMNAYVDSIYHTSGVQSAVASTFLRPLYDQESTSIPKSPGPAQTHYLGVNFRSSTPGRSNPTSPRVPPGLFPTSPNNAFQSSSLSAVSPYTPASSRLPYSPHHKSRHADSPSSVNSPGSPAGNRIGRPPGAQKRGTEQEAADIQLLKTDISAWLRSLRLHKYTPNFSGKIWQEVIQLNDEDLQKMGVAALGARNKMLRVFESARAALTVTEK